MPHPLLEIVFHSFNEAGVRWCVLRPGVDYIRATPPGQIDDLSRRDLADGGQRREPREPRHGQPAWAPMVFIWAKTIRRSCRRAS